MRVLDIGAGSGLFSMIAARVGPANMVACERVPIIAEAAARIVALNDLDRAIRVISRKRSGRPSPYSGFGNHFKRSIGRETRSTRFKTRIFRLLRQGATVIPRAAMAVSAYLVESEVLDKYAAVTVVSGFDVSPFCELTPRAFVSTGSCHLDADCPTISIWSGLT
jgi:predicted nicotinamide N-methyase